MGRSSTDERYTRSAGLFFIGIVDVQPELDAALPQREQRTRRKRNTIITAAHEKATEQVRPERCQRPPCSEIAGELIEDLEDLRFQIFRLTPERTESPASCPGNAHSVGLVACELLALVMRGGWACAQQGSDCGWIEVIPEEPEGYQRVMEYGHWISVECVLLMLAFGQRQTPQLHPGRGAALGICPQASRLTGLRVCTGCPFSSKWRDAKRPLVRNSINAAQRNRVRKHVH